MIKEADIRNHVESLTEGSDIFLVDVKIQPGQKISVLLDTPEGIQIEECGRINKQLRELIGRDDLDLEVSSPGLTKPLKVIEQYYKNLNREVEVLTTEGEKMRGVLKSADEEKISVEVLRKEKVDGKKKEIKERQELLISNIKKTKLVISF